MIMNENHPGHVKEPNFKGNEGEHRTKVDTCLPNIEEFIKNEIVSTKVCACPHCNFKRHMLRAIQQIIKEYKMLVRDRHNHQYHCYIEHRCPIHECHNCDKHHKPNNKTSPYIQQPKRKK